MSASAFDAFVAALVEGQQWRRRAACRPRPDMTDAEVRENVDRFFPYRGQSQKPAKAVCARCPVAAECRAYADESGSSYGIWGGAIQHRGAVDGAAA